MFNEEKRGRRLSFNLCNKKQVPGCTVERFASEGALVISEKDECYPLHEAVALGLVSTVGVLLNSGVNPSRESQKGDLPLLLALKRGKSILNKKSASYIYNS